MWCKANLDEYTCVTFDMKIFIYIDDFGSPVVERRSTENNLTSGTSQKYLKTVYVVDNYAQEYLGRSTLETLLPTIANIVRSPTTN